MNMMKSRLDLHSLFVLGLLAALFFAPAARAQSGKLAGTIVDDAGEPVIGATVFLVGTTLGSVTDLNGNYVVLQIPPAAYSVRFSSVGYTTKIMEGVRIASNQTTDVDVTLSEEVIEGEEVVVTADQPLVDISLTSSMQTLSREDIAVLPVQSLNDVVNLQAGVVDGHFRGGRIGEVQYQVDGVSVNNPYDNASTLNLDRSVLQEVQVISGTFDAEYGQAMSGVVNAVLRTGDPERYEFSFETFVGDFFSPGNDSVQIRSFYLGDVQVPRFPHVQNIDPLTLQNYQASLSGPVPLLKKTTFLVNGQRFVNMGYLSGERRYEPTDSSYRTPGGALVLNGTGNGDVVPMRWQKKWSFLGKLSNKSIGGLNLSYQAIGNFIDRKDYAHTFRFNPDGTATKHEFSLVHGFDISHTLSNTTYYEINLRQNLFDYKDYMYEDVNDPRYFAAGEPLSDITVGYGAAYQGLQLGRFVQRTNSYVGKGALTSQVTKVHLIKVGVEAQRASMEFGAPGRIGAKAVNGVSQLVAITDTIDAIVNKYHPVQAAAFVQDRIEWHDLRIRAGVRFEYFDANATVPYDLANPAGTIAGAPAIPSLTKNSTAKIAIAPRLGVSFPILDRASLFFSYGHFYQMPGLGTIFDNADYSVLRDLQADVVNYGVMGNPDLKPEFTTQYEFGFKSEIASFLGLDISLFYKDIRDLLGVEFISTYTAAEYGRFTNIDFGGVRGFTLSLDQRGPGALTTTLDYTYQSAVGNASDPKETANRAAAGGDPRPRQVPFNWDQRHSLNGTVIWHEPGNYALTGIARFSSGQPYTPAVGGGFDAELEPNSGRKPQALVVDLRAEKFFKLGGLTWTAFGRVFNLFDSHYYNGSVYAETGSPYYTLTPLEQINPDPNRFFAPRRIEIGFSLNGAFGG